MEAELVYGTKDYPYEEGHVTTQFVKHLHWLRGMHGAVSFVWRECLTPESLPDTVKFISEPMGIDLGYHRHVASTEYQTHNEECDALGGKPCYSDGSSLRATAVLDEWYANGKDERWLQQYLNDYYHDVFYDGEPSIDKMGFGEVLGRLSERFSL